MKRALKIKQSREAAGSDLARLYSGELSEKQLRSIRGRHTHDAEYGDEFECMAEMLVDMEGLSSSANIQHILSEPVTVTGYSRMMHVRKPQLALAACLLLSVALVITLYGVNWKQGERLISDRYLTRVGEQRLVELDDGSHIHMNTNTELLVTYSTVGREVTLKRGEAHFEVDADPARPFSVVVNNQRITVLGTAFNLHKKLDRFQLLVVDGQVALHQDDSSLGQLLELRVEDEGHSVSGNLQYRVTPGWAVEVKGTERQMTFHQVSSIDDAMSWRTGLLSFDGAPLYQVVKELNRYSPLKILIEDQSLIDMKIHAAIKVNNLRVALSGIGTAYDIKVEYYSDRIVLTKN